MNPMQMLYQFMMSNQNPQIIIQNILKQNPQANALINQMQSSGMSPRDFCTQFAKQNNIDLNQIRNMMNNFGIKL